MELGFLNKQYSGPDGQLGGRIGNVSVCPNFLVCGACREYVIEYVVFVSLESITCEVAVYNAEDIISLVNKYRR